LADQAVLDLLAKQERLKKYTEAFEKPGGTKDLMRKAAGKIDIIANIWQTVSGLILLSPIVVSLGVCLCDIDQSGHGKPEVISERSRGQGCKDHQGKWYAIVRAHYSPYFSSSSGESYSLQLRRTSSSRFVLIPMWRNARRSTESRFSDVGAEEVYVTDRFVY